MSTTDAEGSNIEMKDFQKKQVWLRRFPRPFIVTSLWIIFYISIIGRDLDEIVGSPTGFYLEGTVF